MRLLTGGAPASQDLDDQLSEKVELRLFDILAQPPGVNAACTQTPSIEGEPPFFNPIGDSIASYKVVLRGRPHPFLRYTDCPG